MAEREIRAVAVDTGAEHSRRLVHRRPGLLLRHLRGRAAPPRVHGDLYWPIDLGVAVATVKLPFRAPRSVAVPVARDAVTGHHGVLDLSVAEPETVTAPEERIVAPDADTDADTDGAGAELTELARNQIVRHHRPTEIRDLGFERFQRVHLPYHVVSTEDGDSVFLVDRLAGRLDLPQRHPHARTVTGHRLTGLTGQAAR